MNNKFKYIALLSLIVLFGCNKDEALKTNLTNFVSFEATPVLVDIEENGSKTIDVNVAASNESNTDRTFNVMVDEESTTLQSAYSVPETVTIPANETLTQLSVTITDDDNLGYFRQDLTFTFEDQAGVDFGDPVTLKVAQECLNTLVTMNLVLDVWPNETTWEVYDLNDPNNPVLIGSGGPYEKPADENAELAIPFCLASGDYGVVVYDSFGDGGPTYSVSSPNGVLVEETTLSSSQSTSQFTVQ